MGGLVGVAALLNAVRFSEIPGNSGVGLELKAIAAVVVGGTAITGGRGTLVGTLIGVALTGNDRNRSDISRDQSVLGKSDPGSDHFGGFGVRRAARTTGEEWKI